jgi:hypothetical protein
VKTEAIHAVFGTRSWTAVEEMNLPELEAGLAVIRKALTLIVGKDEPDVYGAVEAVKAETEKAASESPFLEE